MGKIILKPGWGYWDVTRYPYGGDFHRSSGELTGKIIPGPVKRGDEVRMLLDDDRTIVISARGVNEDFCKIIETARKTGCFVV